MFVYILMFGLVEKGCISMLFARSFVPLMDE